MTLLRERIHFLKHFPYSIHPTMKRNQKAALSHDENTQGSTIQELPTGTGKTAVGYARLMALRERFGDGVYFYVTTNKTLVDQIKLVYNDFHVIYGRNEYPCLYYEKPYKADEIACSLLDDCPHRVNFETGETHEEGAERCPYLDAKYKVKTSKLVVCTMSFYLFTTLFSDHWGDVKGVVVDEAHQIPDLIRNSLSYEITDYHLTRIIEFLQSNSIKGDGAFFDFLNLMKRTVKKRINNNSPLLNDDEIHSFIDALKQVKVSTLRSELKRVVKAKQVSEDHQKTVRKLESVIYDLHKYINAFEYSLETGKRKPLNYTYAYLKPEFSEGQKIEYALHIKCYYVAPVITKIFPKDRTYFMSATLGYIDGYRLETGLQYPFFSHASEFPVENARVYLPTDIENLSMAKASRRSKPNTLRRIAQTCKLFVDKGQRCLVLVVSDEERTQFLRMAAVVQLEVITYDKKMSSKKAVQMFKEGAGDTLLGTFAQFGEGIDLPNQSAPVTFALRPGYPPPYDPKALFEEKRFKNMKWVIWNFKECQRILQARGRNIRSETDRGVTFCMSSQYKSIVLKSLPKWLIPAYKWQLNFDQCVQDAMTLLSDKK